jgi:hypothetical protein
MAKILSRAKAALLSSIEWRDCMHEGSQARRADLPDHYGVALIIFMEPFEAEPEGDTAVVFVRHRGETGLRPLMALVDAAFAQSLAEEFIADNYGGRSEREAVPLDQPSA